MPSKKHIGIAAFAIAIVVGVWFFFGEKDTPNESALQISDSPLAALGTQLSNVDSDGDGLFDWEEVLWKTDPQKKDTDGDGTPDGEEVDRKRDPTVAGPNDLLSASTRIERLQSVDSSSLNDTDRFSREFLETYFTLKESGIPLKDLGQELLFSRAYNAVEGNKPITYNAESLSIKKNPTQEDIKLYGNLIGNSILSHMQGRENELAVLQEALETRQYSRLEDLKDIEDRFSAVQEEVVALSVPEDAISVHLDFLNAAAQMEAHIRTMQNANIDPLQTLKTLSDYQEDQQKMAAATRALGFYFVGKNILFSASDPGYGLTHQYE